MKVLACGCVQGQEWCYDAIVLWGKVSLARARSDWDEVKRLSDEQDRHLDPPPEKPEDVFARQEMRRQMRMERLGFFDEWNPISIPIPERVSFLERVFSR